MATIYKINENGVLRDMTPEEKAEKQASDNAWENGGALEQALKSLRLQRNGLLADSDWEVTMAKEKGTNLSSAFKTWRQELRDIPEGLTTVEEVEGVVFPEKP